jgi:hypothetical protein
MHTFSKKLSIKVIDGYLSINYYIPSTEQKKCSKTKMLKGTTSSRKSLFHKEKSSKYQQKVSPKIHQQILRTG